MARRPPLLTLLLGPTLVLGACASGDAATRRSQPRIEGPPLEIPSYPADDPRTTTGGFVRDVRLVEVERGETTFILMAFEVGGTLTLGAMTKGPFEGTARWQLGDAGLAVQFAAEPRSGKLPVATRNAPAGAVELDGEKAGFGAFQWINVDIDSSRWLPARNGALSLTFEDRDGKRVRLPESGVYAARTVPK